MGQSLSLAIFQPALDQPPYHIISYLSLQRDSLRGKDLGQWMDGRMDGWTDGCIYIYMDIDQRARRHVALLQLPNSLTQVPIYYTYGRFGRISRHSVAGWDASGQTPAVWEMWEFPFKSLVQYPEDCEKGADNAPIIKAVPLYYNSWWHGDDMYAKMRAKIMA